MISIGSLFSGIGGIELGLEDTLPDSRVAWQAERDSFARSVLEKHWPEVRRYEDVRDIDHEAERVDLICGGFPCQDISNAGKRVGIDGERSGLWSEYARIVRVLRPRLVFVENVAALAARGLGRVLGDLAALGFDAEWDVFRAADVGAPHLRERLFILAHARRVGVDADQPITVAGCSRSTDTRVDGEEVAEFGVGLADPNSRGREGERLGGLLDGERSARGDDVDGRGGQNVADAYGGAQRARRALPGSIGEADLGRRRGESCGRGSVGHTNGERRPEWWSGAQVRQRGDDARTTGHSFPPGPGAIDRWDGPQPAVRRGSDGLSRRVDRLRCLGNAVVPQVAAHAFATLAERAGVIA